MSNPKEEIQSTVENLIARGSNKGVVLTALTQITLNLMEKMRLEKDQSALRAPPQKEVA